MASCQSTLKEKLDRYVTLQTGLEYLHKGSLWLSRSHNVLSLVIHSLIHLFNKYLSSTSYLPGTVSVAGDIINEQNSKVPVFLNLILVVRNTDK